MKKVLTPIAFVPAALILVLALSSCGGILITLNNDAPAPSPVPSPADVSSSDPSLTNSVTDTTNSMDTTQSPVAGGTTVANWIPDFKSQAKYVSKSEFEKHQKKHKTSVPILMYHRFYKSKTESKDANDFSVTLFEKQLKYFKDNNFYFPPWDELYCFIQKKCILPDKSVIITSDDFRKSFRKYIPALVDKYKIPVTSFDITGVEKPKWLSPYIIMRSHSDKMHAAGVGGKGRITSWAMKDIVEDLNTSIKKLRGVAQVFAYPFGHYNKHAITGLKKAGFQMAVTVEYGEVKPGANPYLLPRVRRNDGAFFK